MRSSDVLVVGAGPAGLAAAWRLRALGVRVLLVDAGGPLEERSRALPSQQVTGIGGAGLYSDGKFSFYPSATALWTLPSRPALERAWRELSSLLESCLVSVPSLPASVAVRSDACEGWSLKAYPSEYVSLEARRALTQRLFLEGAPDGAHRLHTRVVRCERTEHQRFCVELQTPSGLERVEVGALVCAAGRFLPWSLATVLEGLGVRSVFRRVEVGVRLEAQSAHPFFRALEGVDPKWRWNEGALESWRTFCLCRNGEVVETEFEGLRSCSGRADGPATDRSNLGLLLRWNRETPHGQAVLEALQNNNATVGSLVLTSERDLDARALNALVPGAGERLRVGIEALAAKFPLLTSGAVRVWGPCIEGLGSYPDTREDLEVQPGVWFAGDGTGRFRGLVAALASGLYVAERLASVRR